MNCPVIAVANHKGGSGKTTTCYYMARELVDRGQRVLVVDLDDQGTLTYRLTKGKDWPLTIADLLTGAASFEDGLIALRCHSLVSGGRLCVVPADHRLAWAAARIQAMSPNHMFLRKGLAGQREEYDVILLDCPPSADIVIVNALVAADLVLMCATPSPESWAGMERMRSMVADLNDAGVSQARVMGIIATQVVERANLHRAHLLKMEEDLIGSIPMRIGIDADAQLAAAYKPVADAIVDYLRVSQETEAEHAA